MAKRVTDQEHQRITDAIRKAEKGTAGEIFCVVARASDTYFFSAALSVLAAILVVSLGVAFLLDAWWFAIGVPAFVAAQLVATGAALGLIYFVPALRLRLAPRRWQFMQAHDNALRQFLARNVHLTSERTGVLIFVSLAERYAEIVADAGINAKVPQAEWDELVAGLIEKARSDELADGLVLAIERAGTLLAAHFPPRPGDVNELDDHLVEI
jgi:putative membrane protein